MIWVDELKILIGISINTSGNRIMTSPNGIDWEVQVITPTNNNEQTLNDIVWSPELELFVVVYGASGGTIRPILTSSDAITWTSQATATYTANSSFGGTFQNRIVFLISIALSPELDLLVCITTDGRIISSPDGINWTNKSDPAGDAGRGVKSLSNSNGTNVIWVSELNLFVAVYQGGDHRVFTSTDGINWTIIVVSLNAWNSVAWSPQLSLLCAVADSGTGNRVMTSVDGAN